MAEALLRARLGDRAADVGVGSIGQLFDGRSAEKGAIKAMADRGIDLSTHRSRKQTPAMIADASVILAMEKAHVRDLSVLAPGTFQRTFTLPEFVRLVEAEPPRTDRDLRRWVERLGAEREHLGYLSSDGADEIADPMGRSNRVFRSCAHELEAYVDRLADRIWPAPVPSTP